MQSELQHKRQFKPVHQVEEENKMLNFTAFKTLAREIDNGQHPISDDTTACNSNESLKTVPKKDTLPESLAHSLQLYLYETTTPELKGFKLNEIEDKPKSNQQFNFISINKQTKSDSKPQTSHLLKSKLIEGLTHKVEEVKKKEDFLASLEDVENYENINIQKISDFIPKTEASKKDRMPLKYINDEDREFVKDLFADELLESDFLKCMKVVKISPEQSIVEKSKTMKQRKMRPKKKLHLDDFEIKEEDEEHEEDNEDHQSDDYDHHAESEYNEIDINEELQEILYGKNNDSDVDFQANIMDIIMDLGSASRELAPLKLKRPESQKLKSKNLNKVSSTDADSFFNNHFFHHLMGLSNLAQCLNDQPELMAECALQGFINNIVDQTVAKESSYEDQSAAFDKSLFDKFSFHDQTTMNNYQSIESQQQKFVKIKEYSRSSQNNGMGDMDCQDSRSISKSNHIRSSHGYLKTKVNMSETDSEAYSDEKNDDIMPLRTQISIKSGAQTAQQLKLFQNKDEDQKGKSGFKRMNTSGNQDNDSMRQQSNRQSQQTLKNTSSIQQTSNKNNSALGGQDAFSQRKKSGSMTNGTHNQSISDDQDLSKFDILYVGKVERDLEPIEQILRIRDANKHDKELTKQAKVRLDHYVSELLSLINSNQEKSLPLKILNRCLALQNEETLDEELKAKYLIAILREFRKNREQNKQIQHSRVQSASFNNESQNHSIKNSTKNVKKTPITFMESKSQTQIGKTIIQKGVVKSPMKSMKKSSGKLPKTKIVPKSTKSHRKRQDDDIWIGDDGFDI